MTAMPKQPAPLLLATAPDATGILACVAKFFAGTEYRLHGTEAGMWNLLNAKTGRQLVGFRVVLKGKRFRFEAFNP